jgi:hypothetical protein
MNRIAFAVATLLFIGSGLLEWQNRKLRRSIRELKSEIVRYEEARAQNEAAFERAIKAPRWWNAPGGKAVP